MISDVLSAESNRHQKDVFLCTDQELRYTDIVSASFGNAQVSWNEGKVACAFEYLHSLVEKGKAIYGVTTSFGGNVHHVIPREDAEALQENLIVSHACSVGEYAPYHLSKAALVLRTLTLAKGYSGVSPSTLRMQQQLLEQDVIPAIRLHGSLGASGDIGPLATIALTMIGKGYAWKPNGSGVVPATERLDECGLEPIKLTYKEGLALLNGTSMMTSVSCFYLQMARRLIENSIVVGAMSVEALRASKHPYDARLHALKPHRFSITTARVMESILRESRLARSHRELKESVEEEACGKHEAFFAKTDIQGGSYSLRAIPHIYHPILALFQNFEEAVNTEINAVDDNPLLLPESDEQLHGAHFHGYPIAVAADCLNLALIGLSNTPLSRIDRLLKSHHSLLPWFLATGTEGLHLGMHGLQFTAAGIGNELRNLALPNSVEQIPTNNDNQDVVSFGLQATLKGMEIVSLLAYVVAIEYMCAGQGIWLNLHGKSEVGPVRETDLSPVSRAAFSQLQDVYRPEMGKDQNMVDQVESLARRLLTDSLLPDTESELLWEEPAGLDACESSAVLTQ
jgi:histidine ammonia-lyase